MYPAAKSLNPATHWRTILKYKPGDDREQLEHKYGLARAHYDRTSRNLDTFFWLRDALESARDWFISGKGPVGASGRRQPEIALVRRGLQRRLRQGRVGWAGGPARRALQGSAASVLERRLRAGKSAGTRFRGVRMRRPRA